MNSKLEKLIQNIYYKFPVIRPIMASFYRKFLVDHTFSGWGMQTVHELPWNGISEQDFRNDCTEIIKTFEFTPNSTGTDKYNVDELMWRHWFIHFSIQYVHHFTTNTENNFVECGVGDGMTTFFALKEISRRFTNSNFKMYLYDSWDSMKEEDLHKSEITNIGRYSNLNVERTKKNLIDFQNNLIYNVGYIPDSFSASSPDKIIYLHIDLNSTKPTIDALNFFFPRLLEGGIIIFDDYGNTGYPDTKKQIDEFFKNKPGVLMKSPTGQAIFFR